MPGVICGNALGVGDGLTVRAAEGGLPAEGADLGLVGAGNLLPATGTDGLTDAAVD